MEPDKLLDSITSPDQLRGLSDSELSHLADELRDRIISVVAARGGHLASNLGVAELAIALHYVFDFPSDRLLWDVGHQCYAHKLLTGRNDRFDTLRQNGGVSGFPSPDESPYDLFATGHAGTAISTALGLAWSDRHDGLDTKVVAVVGDASIANGMSLEGINNLAVLKRQFLVVLNDNSMAIDRTRGGLAYALDRVRLTDAYTGLKHSTENILHHLPLGDEISDAIRNIKAGLKTTIHGRQVFEALGLGYFGPVDGHNIPDLIRVLRRLKKIDHPVILHVNTVKGRGCQYAIEDPRRFHSPSAFDASNGKDVSRPKRRATWTEAFADTIVRVGRDNPKVVAITAAMPDGTGLVKFREEFPDRYVDVGINESHAVAMAAGMAKTGMRPVVAIYSTFMQRAMDQIFHDVCLQGLGVVLCMDRAGLVGSDGAVHHGTMDIAMLRAMPGITLMAPADKAELQAALTLAVSLDGPSAIRYPRDEMPEDLPGECPPFKPGTARVISEGTDGTFLCYGATLAAALDAGRELSERGMSIGVVNARFAKPLDAALIRDLIATGKPVVVCEDHAVIGGFGSAVLEVASHRDLSAENVRLLGLPDRFIAHASRAEQLTQAGLDAESLASTLKEMIDNSPRH
ncbi:MAG: 1-deoxy-D-xylulose-5-phosphate synthase [Phycisphaerae bacterium]|jgi:1-deoxy-D-xylulose-5-phosphate synthase|nr:1-deoxy-D-xylulose-5-phosphate synthase [Phycisphaerae bacterium]